MIRYQSAPSGGGGAPRPPVPVLAWLLSVSLLSAFSKRDPFDYLPDPAAKHHIDTDRSHSEQREHKEQRERQRAGSARLDCHDGQKNGQAHQHTQLNQGQCQTLNGCRSLTRGFPGQLLSSTAGRGSLFISPIAYIAVSSTLILVAHFFLLKHTASPFHVVACRHPTGHAMRIHLVARISSTQVPIH